MKSVLTGLVFTLLSFAAMGQTTAPDFTAVDCNGNSHNLYTELNSGKIVIIVWVMPCWGCISGTTLADSTVQDLAAQTPDGMLLWIVDDGPPSDCAYVINWIASIGLHPQTVFGNYSNEIDQDNYGGPGMPHITVIGPDKTIFYNEFNGTAGNGLYDAVQHAIDVVTSVNNTEKPKSFTISPNPVRSTITITSANAIETIDVMTISGQVVKEFKVKGSKNTTINIDGIAAGNYLLKVRDNNGAEEIQKFIKQN